MIATKKPPKHKLPSKAWQKLLRLIPGYDPFCQAGGCWFDPVAAQKALDFFPECLRHVEGAMAGKPFALEPWQQAIVANLFGWFRLDEIGRTVRRYREGLIYVSRKNGKALAIDTPIATPSGWTTMGEIKAGDMVFDHDGNPTRVISAFDTLHNRQCYRVEFSDGESIVCDEEHLWETIPRKTHRGTACPWAGMYRGDYRTLDRRRVFTTKEIRDTISVDNAFNIKTNRVEWNHKIPVCGPLILPNIELPIDPYTLGVWLGDGDSDCARITNSSDDNELLIHLGNAGSTATIQRVDHRSKARRVLVGRGWLQSRLRESGLLNNKHIPNSYLRASLLQRTALLQGLMDTDGYCSKAGQCEFTTTNESLRDGFIELARSIGLKPQLKTARAMLNGVDCGKKYRINFFAYDDQPVFRLRRKCERLKPRPASETRSMYRQIIAVTPVESVPVRCIAVDNPRKLYLAGRGMIPTHNTPLVAGIACYVFFCDDEAGQQGYVAAGEREQAGALFRQVKGMVTQEPELSSRCRIYGGNAAAGQSKSLVREEDGSFLRVIAATGDTQHGGNTHLAIIDELHVQKDRDLFDVFTTSMASLNRKNPLFISITTADFDGPSICNEVHERACKVRDNGGDPLKPGYDPAFLPVIYETQREEDWKSPEVWRKANPNLGVSVSLGYLERECKKAQENPAYENTFKRLHLNMQTEQDCRVIPMDQWERCGQGAEPKEWRERMLVDCMGRQCTAGLDLGSVSDLTAFVLLFGDDDEGYDVLPFFWTPENNAHQRERKDSVPYLAWVRQGFMTMTDGNETDYQLVRREIGELGERYGIEIIAADRLFQGVQICQDLMRDGFNVEAFGQGYVTMAAPTRRFLELVAAGKLRHGNNPVLRWMASNAATEAENSGNGDVLKFSKKKSPEKIDGIIATTMALGERMKLQVDGVLTSYDQPGSFSL